jgi:FKBP-type peptidyl-prolyl cis-trans isomerase FkpA
MKKYLLFFGALFILCSSCIKTSTAPPFNAAQQAITDDNLIKAYIAANNITAVKDSSGLYYSVITPGTGAYPTLSSTVNVNYSGKLLSGAFFAQTGPLTSRLATLILGWQIGVPHINTGGTILLLVPSALGYGNSSPGDGIPANSVLVFTINLVNFTN